MGLQPTTVSRTFVRQFTDSNTRLVSSDRGTAEVPSGSGTLLLAVLVASFNELRRKGFVDIGRHNPYIRHKRLRNLVEADKRQSRRVLEELWRLQVVGKHIGSSYSTAVSAELRRTVVGRDNLSRCTYNCKHTRIKSSNTRAG